MTATEARARRTARLFVIAGWLLIALGAIHIAVMPLVTPWMRSGLAPGSPRLGAFVLDHVVVTLLLVPLGGLTVYAGRAIATGERWARAVCTTTAITGMTLPIAVVGSIDRSLLAAWPFVTALAVMAAAAVVLLIAAIRVARVDPQT